MRKKVMSIFISAMMVVSISVSMAKNVGEPSSSGTTGLPLSNNSGAIPQNVGQPSSSLGGSGGLADSPWPMFRGNLDHTGLSPYDTSGNQGNLRWSFTTGDDVFSSPAIGSDGTIYVGSMDHRLYAINPDGTKKWNFTAGDVVNSSPAIGSDGTIYVGSMDHRLYAINPDGTQKWNYMTGLNVTLSSPAIGSDGTIYIGSHDGKLHAINPDGSQKWNFQTGSQVFSSPAIGSDGTIYVGSSDQRLYAINPDGTEKWSFTADDMIWSSPAIGLDGTIYVGSYDTKLYAINPDGTQKWNFTTGYCVSSSSPAIGPNNTIYFSSWDNKLYAINPNGTQKWNFTTGDWGYSSPAISSDGTIYVGSWGDNKLYAINSDGTEKWSFTTGFSVFSSPAIGSDGTVYIGSLDSKLYAIGTLTPNLKVNVTSHFSELNSAAQSLITVHVTDGTNPVQGATVNLVSDNGGIFSPQSGINDVNGDFKSIFNAPTVTSQIICRISAEAGKTGYNDGSGYVDVTINPIPWPMFRHNLRHTGQSPYDTSSNPGKLKWSFTTGDRIKSSPAIGSDGTIYFGSWDFNLYAINPDGSEKWNFKTGNRIYRSSPAIGSDGTIYIGSMDYNLYAINPDGTKKWSFKTSDSIIHSPAIGSDGTIYIGSSDNKLYAINPDGTQKWSFITKGPIRNSPAIDINGTIYIGSEKDLYAINQNGTQKWVFTVSEWLASTPAISSDGTIYMGYSGNKLYAINPDGTIKWIFTTISSVDSDPAVSINGTIYVGCKSHIFYAINPNGTEKWNFIPDGDTETSASIGSDGTIYMGSADNKLYAINADGTEKWNFSTNGYIHAPPAIDSDGTIYLGSSDGTLYAIGEGGTPPIADAGPDQIVNERDVVYFNGSGSVGGSGVVRGNVDIVMMLDDSGSMADKKLDDLKIAAKNFIGRMLPNDRVAIYSFYMEEPERDQSFVRLGDSDVFGSGKTGYEYTIGTIDALSATSCTPLWDTCYEAIKYADTNKKNFPVVIAMTDGDDFGFGYEETGSETYCPGALSTDPTSTWYHKDGDCKWGISRFYDEVIRYHVGTDITIEINQTRTGLISCPILVYTIGLGTAHDYHYVNGARNPPLDYNGNHRLTEYDLWNLADSSKGIGKYYYAPDSSELDSIYENISKEIGYRNLTIVSYEWDFESDGIYDYQETPSNAPDGTFDGITNHVYGDDGIFKATLRVTNNQNLTDIDTCNITVLNVDPKVTIESAIMEVEIGLRVAGRKYNNVSMTLSENEKIVGYVSIERMPGSPNEQMAWIPVSINFSRSYSAIVTYIPKDPTNIGANPVWIYIKSDNGSMNKIHHTFNVQQSKKRDSDHWNHVEPWEVDLNAHFIGLPFEITSHIIDPGSDDETLTFTYGSQVKTVIYLNNPPNLDPFPSPEVQPMDIKVTTTLVYEGPGTVTLVVKDDDNIRLGVGQGSDSFSVS